MQVKLTKKGMQLELPTGTMTVAGLTDPARVADMARPHLPEEAAAWADLTTKVFGGLTGVSYVYDEYDGSDREDV